MSESKTPSELTEPGDRTEAMMYWHERAMKAESDLAAALARTEAAERRAKNEHEWAIKRDGDYAEAQDKVAALAARVAELETWQPIETAPKDGTWVLLATHWRPVLRSTPP